MSDNARFSHCSVREASPSLISSVNGVAAPHPHVTYGRLSFRPLKLSLAPHLRQGIVSGPLSTTSHGVRVFPLGAAICRFLFQKNSGAPRTIWNDRRTRSRSHCCCIAIMRLAAASMTHRVNIASRRLLPIHLRQRLVTPRGLRLSV